MIEKSLLEIKGTFLVKIRDNAFKGIDGENVFAHINNFLEIAKPLKIRGLSHDQFKLSVFPISLSGSASEWFRNECIGTNATWEGIVEKFTQNFYHIFDHIEEEEDDEDYDPHTFDDVPKIFKIKDELQSIKGISKYLYGGNDYERLHSSNTQELSLGGYNGKMIEKSLLEIEGTFLVKIRDNAFKGIDGENVFAHINNFLKIVEPLKIRGLSHDQFKLSVFPISLSGSASEWFRNECIGTNATWEGIVEKFTRKFYHIFDHIEEEEDDEDYDPHTFDDVPKIFKIKDDLFSFDTPLCIAFDEFNYLLKIDLDIFIYEIQKVETYDEKEQELNNDKTQGPNEPWSENRGPYQPCNHICEPYRFKDGRTKWPTCSSDIDGFCNGGEIPGMVRVGHMAYSQDYKWYDSLIDGELKEGALMLKAQIKGSWGDATPDMMKFCTWLIDSFENFHELDYNVLVKLQECWWKINAHETTPFTRTENFRHGSYANVKTEWNHDPYLDANRIFNRTNGASNVGNTQEDKGHEEAMVNPTPKHSVCKIRRFEMMKYSFDSNDEYITIKEFEHLNHSKKSIDAYRELLRLTNEGWVVTTSEE
ncbi:hypothetical protein Tco_0247366 [Tanacetum coccineum]